MCRAHRTITTLQFGVDGPQLPEDYVSHGEYGNGRQKTTGGRRPCGVGQATPLAEESA